MKPFLFLGCLVALLATGCATKRGGPGGGMRLPPVPQKQGTATYFDGAVLATVDLGPMARPEMPASGEGREEGERPSGRPARGSGGPPPGEGGPGRGGGSGGGRRGGGMAGMNYPPARIRLTLQNRGTEPVDVRVAAFDSSLGNFALQPERLTLGPDTSTSLEPVVSRLGVGEGDIPITVTLVRVGGRETQTIVLHDLRPAAGDR